MTQELETKEWRLSIGEGGDLPPDAFESQEDMLQAAIDMARDMADDYVMPASWFAIIDGNHVLVHRHSYKTKKKVLTIPTIAPAVLAMIEPHRYVYPDLSDFGYVFATIGIGLLVVLFVWLIVLVLGGPKPPADEDEGEEPKE